MSSLFLFLFDSCLHPGRWQTILNITDNVKAIFNWGHENCHNLCPSHIYLALFCRKFRGRNILPKEVYSFAIKPVFDYARKRIYKS